MWMWNLTENHLKQVPPLYSSEFIPFPDKIIHLHLILKNCHFFIVESDGLDICFSLTVLSSDLIVDAGWGHISLNKLKAIKVGDWLKVDLSWVPTPASEIIRKAYYWPPLATQSSLQLDGI